MNHLISYALLPVAGPITHWAQHSQRQACRNAMVATTALAAGRRERESTSGGSRLGFLIEPSPRLV